MPKQAIQNFKGIARKVAFELMSESNSHLLTNLDFSYLGALNLRGGVDTLYEDFSQIYGLKRFYGTAGLRALMLVDETDFYNVDVAGDENLLNKYSSGLATTATGDATVTIAMSGSSVATGWRRPTAKASQFNVSGEANVYTSDNAYATLRDNVATSSGFLSLDDFGFSSEIPAGSTIQGFEVKAEGYDTNIATTNEGSISIRKHSDLTYWVVSENPGFGTSDAEYTYGNSTAVFGTTWTYDDVAGADFGISFSLVRTPADAYQRFIDTVSVRVYYTAPSGASPVLTENISAGDFFSIDGGVTEYEIDTVTNNTDFELTTTFPSNNSGVAYQIRRPRSNQENTQIVTAQNISRVFFLNGEDRPMYWDGSGEQAYVLGLDTPSACSAAEGVAGALGAGTYKYKVTLVSELEESNPSTAASVTIGASKKVDLTSIALGPSDTVARNIYRTTVGTDVYYLLTTIENNSATTYTDNITDAVLSAGDALFTEDHSVPPTYRIGEWHQNRLFGVQANSNILWFSEIAAPGHVQTTNSIRSLNGENIVAVRSLGSALAIYTRSSIQMLFGTSPEDFQLSAVDTMIGVSGYYTVSNVPGNAHIFLSNDGLYLFRGTTPTRVSDGVERLLFDSASKYRINRASLGTCFSVFHNSKYYLFYPRGTATANDTILVFDLSQNDYYIYLIGASAATVYYGEGDSYEFVFGDISGNVNELFSGYDDNGENITGIWESKYIDFKTNEKKMLKSMYFKVFSEGNATVRIELLTDTQSSAFEQRFEVPENPAGQELFFQLPPDFVFGEMKVRLKVESQSAFRMERIIVNFDVQKTANANKES